MGLRSGAALAGAAIAAAGALTVIAAGTGEPPWRAVLVVAGGGAAAGVLLASGTARGLARAAHRARAVAAGDAPVMLPLGRGRELRHLGETLSEVSTVVQRRLGEGQEQQRRAADAARKLGRASTGGGDLSQRLERLIDAAVACVGADRAVLALSTPDGEALWTRVSRGIDPFGLPVGQGVLGSLARSGASVRLPADAPLVAPRTDGEPVAAQQLAVPLLAADRILGVLSVLRDRPEPAWQARDLDTLRALAAQAAAGVENVVLQVQAQRLTVHDPLTGLWNLRSLSEQAERVLHAARRHHRPVALLIVDLDHLAAVRTRHGQDVADGVLSEVASRLAASTRLSDITARYGDEQVAVLLPDADAAGAAATAERLRQTVAACGARRAGADQLAVRVTASIGIAVGTEQGSTFGELARSAGGALSTAKLRGRDRVGIAGGQSCGSPSGPPAESARMGAGLARHNDGRFL